MIDLTDGQKKTIAYGTTVLSLVVTLSFAVFLVWGFVRLVSFASAALVPVIMGFFLSLFFRPYYRWWLKVARNPTLALVIMLITVFAPLGLLLWTAGALIVDQLTNLIAQGPDLVHQVSDWFTATFPKLSELTGNTGLPAKEDFSAIYTKYASTAFKAGTGALKCLMGLVSSLVTLVFFVFFLMTKDRRGGELVAGMPFLKEDTRTFVAEQIDAFVEILVSFFQRQAVICLLEGCLYGIGFWAVGLPYGFMIGFALGILNIIPMCGSILCLPVALPLAYFGGGSVLRLCLVLAVWIAGQILDGYFITPRIQGNRTGLGYAGVIFSFFFWATVLGPLLGMLLAIPLSAFCVVLWRAVKARYIRPVV